MKRFVQACFPLCAAIAIHGVASPALAEDCAALDAIEAFQTAKAPPEGATCVPFRGQTGAEGVSCHWGFAFRDAAADTFAATLWEALSACRPGQVGAPDQAVNHPDSFALREWLGKGAVYRVSVKDKGGQGRTLVFLGYEGG